ncbi:MAG: M48 family metallopeptidase [Cytophagaceae bacterium]|jgi:STE24 endopeptidase|nr:M48 family metallopeptidase [Cytophagaceae bacterium]
MSANELLFTLLGIITFDFILERLLNYLNISYLNHPLPENVRDIYPVDEYNTSQKYLSINNAFDQKVSWGAFLIQLIVLYFGYLGLLYDWTGALTAYPLLNQLLFFGLLFIISDLTQTPFTYYKTFVIEEAFGFNKTTRRLFILDKLKSYFLVIIIGGGILGCLLWLIDVLAFDFWWIFWIIISVLILGINMFYTSVLLPLFNKLTPLEDGELKTAIQSYGASQNFPIENIFIMDGSKRSNKANAFFSGFGKNKKIVLFDTLVQQHTTEEIIAVLAHEAGHFKKKHIPQMMLLSIVQMGIYLFVLSQFIFSSTITQALGSTASSSPALNLIGFALLFTPISTLTGLFVNLYSRKNEYEADAFAASTYSATHLIDALKKLSRKNLSNLTPHPAYVFLHYSHPPISERIKAMNKER